MKPCEVLDFITNIATRGIKTRPLLQFRMYFFESHIDKIKSELENSELTSV
jgi:hypothetical protein